MNWTLVKKKLADLNPYEKNPRRMTEKGMKDLKTSLNKFGVAEPIVLNTDSTIVGGHARFYALKEQGIKEVDCYIPDKTLTENEFKELNIRLNKNIAGEFDFDILANEFELEDLLEWGFEEKELDLSLWNDIPEEKLDEVPEVQKVAISKLGDSFLLDGRHRVFCNDSTDKKAVEVLMDGKKADMVFTDPPYNVDYSSKDELLNLYDKGNHIQTPIKNDNIIDPAEYQEFIKKFWNALKSHLSDYNSVYVCGNYESLIQFYKMEKLKISNMIVWVKNVMILGRMDYQNKHEFILYGWLGKHKWYGDRKQTTVWDFNKPMKSDLHPTMKPIELIKKAILNSTQSGNNIVIDVFLGSGSTLVACEQTNRICYGMEIDPIYIDVILRRYHNLYPDKKIECINRDFNFGELWQDQEKK